MRFTTAALAMGMSTVSALRIPYPKPDMTPSTISSTDNTPSATPATTADAMTVDKFAVVGLKSMAKNGETEVSFSIKDLSTSPVEMTSCHIRWNNHKHQPRGPIKCENGWFTTSLLYFDDLDDFAIQINHAYGETCVGCNDEENERYNGVVGTCTFMVDSDEMTMDADSVSGSHEMNVGSGSATANRNIKCPVDFNTP